MPTNRAELVPWFTLVPPAAVPDELPRDAVVAALDEAVRRGPLTVVAAPSGFGKSVACAQWCRSRGGVGWVNASAPAEARLMLEAGVWAAVTAAGLPAPRVGAGFVEGLTALLEGLTSPVHLVVDDAHVVDGRLLRELLLADAVLSSGMLRIVLVGQPSITTAVVGLAGDVEPVEIGTELLAYSPAELTGRFGAAGVELGRTTSGWPVAVRLATLTGADAYRGGSGLALGAAADDALLTDYIGEVLLPSLRPELRDVVLDSAVLGRVETATAEAVLGPGAADLLAECHSAGLFLVREEAGGRVGYRWHDEFVVHCLRLARRRDHDRVRRVELAAATALRAERPLAAAAFAVRAGDADLAVQIVLAEWLRLLLSANPRALSELCRSLPATHATLPDVLRVRACCRRFTGEQALSVHLYQRAVATEEAEGGEPSLVALLSDGYLTDDPDIGLRAIDRAEARLSSAAVDPVDPDAEIDVHTRFFIGWVRTRRRSDPDGGAATMRRLADEAEARGLDYLTRYALVDATISALWAGRLRVARATIDRLDALPGGVDVEWAGLNTGLEAAGRGMVEYWSGDFTAAVHRHLTVVRDADSGREARNLAALGLALSVADGRYADLQEEAWAALATIPDGYLHGMPWGAYRRAASAYLRTAFGDSQGAIAQLAQLVNEPLDDAVLFAYAASTLRSVGFAEHVPAVLHRVHTGAASAVASTLATATEALLAENAGDRVGAVELLEESLDCAAPEELWQPFLCPDPAMLGLLEELRRGESRHRDAAEMLVARLSSGRSFEKLTSRETDVLELLRSVASAAEIAVELGVTLSTVKTHIRSIYRKLGVTSRRAALRVTDRSPLPRRGV